MTFQFHKGTIKPFQKHQFDDMMSTYFNSIKVRLNQSKEPKPKFPHILFQFHKGTIKPFFATPSLFALLVFQFHKGTIKPRMTAIRRPVVRQFQFHKGTIKP